MLIRKRVPDIGQIEKETSHRAFALHLVNPRTLFDLPILPVNFHRAAFRVNEPTQLCAIGQILHHFPLQRPQTITFRPHFNYKIGAKMPEGFPFIHTQLLQAVFQCPRSIGRAPRTVGEYETSGGITNNASAVHNCPIAELKRNPRITSASVRMRWGHNDQFPLLRHFKVKVGMFGAEPGKLLVGHRMSRQGCRQKGIVKNERHGFSLAQQKLVLAGAAKAWGQNDDITVVTVRRND